MDTPKGVRTPNIIHRVAGGAQRDNNDDYQARQGRERTEGHRVGQFLQTPPFFFTADHHPVPLVDSYRGRSVFIVASGPSFGLLDHSLLDQAGIMTFGLNNSVRSFRPNIWACVDTPANFMLSTWLDPRIMKFAPICHTQKNLFDNNAWKETNTRVMDCPNVFFYKRNEHFQADQFLWEDTINWGNHKKYGGGRSILLAVIRICYLLGFRRVYLLGVDFEMSETAKYHFEQDRAKGSINGNNSTYRMLVDRFTQLKPYFAQESFEVFQCNEKSKLDVFPKISYEEAIKRVLAENLQSIDVKNDRTAGLYDRMAQIEKEQKEKAEGKKAEAAKIEADKRWTDADRQEVKDRLDTKRGELDVQKNRLAEHNRRPPKPEDPEAVRKRHAQLADQIQQDVDAARTAFRTCEDEKRVKWGELPKWGLWHPPVKL